MNFWLQPDKWKLSAKNTFYCLLGCSVGDFGTIYYFQEYTDITDVMLIMPIAMFNGIITSIILETLILIKNMSLKEAFKTACGMSLISMIAMELAMNLTDLYLYGQLIINLKYLPIILLAGFITPWPYNYWRLVKYNSSCCG